MLSPFYPNVRLHLTLMLIYCYVFVMRTNYKLSSSSSLYECSSIGDDRHDWYHYYYYYFCQYYIFIIPYSKIKSLNYYYCYYHPLFFILSPLNYIDIPLNSYCCYCRRRPRRTRRTRPALHAPRSARRAVRRRWNGFPQWRRWDETLETMVM